MIDEPHCINLRIVEASNKHLNVDKESTDPWIELIVEVYGYLACQVLENDQRSTIRIVYIH